jgi:dTMP kinase
MLLASVSSECSVVSIACDGLPMFFSVDGVDGTGKSTQIRLLAEALRQRGREVVTCRDPGSTALGERLREILLHHHGLAIHRRSEMLLYMAARAQLVEEVIRPALAANQIVISDRYLLANVVYQAYAGGLDADDVWRVGEVTVAGIMPRLVFLLDMPAEKAANRIQREPDRIEAQGPEYLERVRQGFLTEARRWPQSVVVLNADRPPEGVHADILANVERAIASQESG